jgi:hypothetical protein
MLLAHLFSLFGHCKISGSRDQGFRGDEGEMGLAS